jgi:hypothetical protein
MASAMVAPWPLSGNETSASRIACDRTANPIPGFRSGPVSVGGRTGLCQPGQSPPGNGSSGAKTGPGFCATAAYSTRQRLGSPTSPSPKPREVKDNSAGARKPDLCRTAWWRTHSPATSLQTQFPANREINREFVNFRPFFVILAPYRRANSAGYNKIPYATEQGIILTEQGIILTEQGICPPYQRTDVRRPFFTQLFCS